ncbi:MAG: zinc ABC transporter substrate-binding protein, partial [Actinomycetota bacterium]|nr:zinc ABC transporter substrate-binding protein [Actinomycetota bacterium]
MNSSIRIDKKAGAGGFWGRSRLAVGALAGFLVAAVATGCGSGESGEAGAAEGKIQATTTTTMITDLVRQIGGDRVEVTGLMGPGVDPHLY